MSPRGHLSVGSNWFPSTGRFISRTVGNAGRLASGIATSPIRLFNGLYPRVRDGVGDVTRNLFTANTKHQKPSSLRGFTEDILKTGGLVIGIGGVGVFLLKDKILNAWRQVRNFALNFIEEEPRQHI